MTVPGFNGEAVASYSPGLPQRSGGYPG